MDILKILKLVSGETIVAFIKESEEGITINKPIQFTLVPRGQGAGTLMASEWIQSDEEVFTLKHDHIVAKANPTDTLKSFYLKSINEFVSDKSNQRVLDNLIQDFEIKSSSIH